MSSRRSLLSLNLPKEILSTLTRNGYEYMQDITAVNPETLAKDLNLSLDEVEALISRFQNGQTLSASLPMTQSAAVMARHSQRVPTKSTALDALLEGGLPRDHILEISGPPGSPKESLAVGIVDSFINLGEDVIFVDCENMTSSSSLQKSLDKESNMTQNVYYMKAHNLAELFFFLHRLPSILSSQSKISLLVINSISFPFQSSDLGIAQKNAQLDRVKQWFSKLGAAHHLTIITTSQLATKMVNADGTPGTFDSGARGIMLPQLGSGYLPNGRTYRVIVSPDGFGSGYLKLLSSPKYPSGNAPPNKPEQYMFS